MVEQGVHRYVHEICVIRHRSASGSGFSPLHEIYGIHTLVLLTVLVDGLHVTNTAVGSFNRPFLSQAQWTLVYCLIRRTTWPWGWIHWYGQGGNRTQYLGQIAVCQLLLYTSHMIHTPLFSHTPLFLEQYQWNTTIPITQLSPQSSYITKRLQWYGHFSSCIHVGRIQEYFSMGCLNLSIGHSFNILMKSLCY